ncbi:MAG: hypothetical protein ACTSVZ_06275 [Promethearchaeota archaeon]
MSEPMQNAVPNSVPKGKSMNLHDLWLISKYSYHEAFLQGKIEQEGGNLASFNEKLEKNVKHLRNSKVFTKVIMTLYVSLLIFSPISVFTNVKQAMGEVNAQWGLYTGSMVLNFYFFTQLFYIMMFGLFFVSGILSGEGFRWLSILPVPRKDLGKISIMTFFRGIDAPVIAICLVFPIATFIMTQSLFLSFITLIVSIINTVFTFSLLIIFGTKFRRIITGGNSTSSKASFTRILWFVGYILASSIVTVGFQMIPPLLKQWYLAESLTISTTQVLNLILPWIPFPFSPGYLVMNGYLGFENVPSISLLGSVIGTLILGGIDVILMRKALRILEKVASQESEVFGGSGSRASLSDVTVITESSVKAFLRRDRKLIPRDIQAIMLNLMPILFPILGVFMVTVLGNADPTEVVSALLGTNTIYFVMGGLMVSLGLLSVESTGATINQSLPIVVRDQLKAKLKWIFTVILLSLIIPIVILIGTPYFLTYLKHIIVVWFVSPIAALSTLILHTLMFGKVKNKYVLEEQVNIKFKGLKVASIFVINFSFAIGMIIGMLVSIISQPYWFFVLVFLGGQLGLLSILGWILKRLFPKPKK